jgi:hypothetical protein
LKNHRKSHQYGPKNKIDKLNLNNCVEVIKDNNNDNSKDLLEIKKEISFHYEKNNNNLYNNLSLHLNDNDNDNVNADELQMFNYANESSLHDSFNNFDYLI